MGLLVRSDLSSSFSGVRPTLLSGLPTRRPGRPPTRRPRRSLRVHCWRDPRAVPQTTGCRRARGFNTDDGTNPVRTVLDHQVAVLADVDDKAARTVRVAVIVLAVVLGVATYSFSTPNFGPRSADLDRVLDEKYGEVEWLVVLLDSYADWIDRTAAVNLFNGMLFAFAQAALGVGVSLLAIGTATRFDAFAVDPLTVTPASAPVRTI